MSKHVPARTCVICREKAGKRMLTRIVRAEHGIIIDPTGKLNGRGAYLCDEERCWSKAATSDILAQALKTTLTDSDRQYLQQRRKDVHPEPDSRTDLQP